MPSLKAGAVLIVTAPQAVGGKVVIGNLTSDNTSTDGFVTAFDCTTRPTASDLNTKRGDIRSNRLLAKANDAGQICLYTNTATDLIVDLNGIASVNAFKNQRTDTRISGARLSAGSILRVSVPEAAGGKVVVGNLTSDNTAVDGFVTAFDCDTRPLASDLNTRIGDIRSNRLIAAANLNGDVCFYSDTATDLIVDVNGVASSTSLENQRTDTRPSGFGSSAPVAANGVLRVSVPAAAGGKLVVGNLTSDNTAIGGYVTGYACDQLRPGSSDLNTVRGDIRSNRYIGAASQTGEVCFYTNSGTDLVVDINGILVASAFPNLRIDTRK